MAVARGAVMDVIELRHGGDGWVWPANPPPLLVMLERTVDPVVGDMQFAGLDTTPGPGPPVVDITQLNILSVEKE